MNVLIRDLFSKRRYGEAIRILQAEFSQVSFELEQVGSGTCHINSEVEENWFIVTPVPILGIFSDATNPDAPPNAFAVYPYLLEMDSALSGVSDYLGGVRNTSSPGEPRGPHSCVCTYDVPSPATSGHCIPKMAHDDIGRCQRSFSSAIGCVTHLYNFAMAHICLSTKSEIPTFHLQSACHAIRWIVKLLNCIRTDVLNGSNLVVTSAEHYLYRHTLINQLRLAALNNLGYVYSIWGQQALVNECLELLDFELLIRGQLAEELYLSQQRTITETQPSTKAEPSKFPEPQRDPLYIDGVDCPEEIVRELEQDEEGGARQNQVRTVLQTLLAQLGGSCEDEGLLVVYLNVQYLSPTGSTPVSGASVA
jgi:hypothetical protein